MSIATQISALQTDKTNIANAITTMGGTVASGDGFDNFASDIQTIPQGGGGQTQTKSLSVTQNGSYTVTPDSGYTLSEVDVDASVLPVTIEPKDITFYDWDGTVLYAYTFEEIANLTDLPPLPPNYKDYTADSWTETLSFLQGLTVPFNVGVNYTTTRTSTKFYITLDDLRLNVNIFNYSSNNTNWNVDWGDGTTGSVSRGQKGSHSYSLAGDYVVSVTAASSSGKVGLRAQSSGSGSNIVLSGGGVIYSEYDWTYDTSIAQSSTPDDIGKCFYNSILKAIEPGVGTSGKFLISDYGLIGASDVKKMIVPKGSKIDRFGYTYSGFEFVSLPSTGTIGSASYMFSFQNMKKLKRVVLPSVFEAANTIAPWQTITSSSATLMLFMNCENLVEYLPTTVYNASNWNTAMDTFAGKVESDFGNMTQTLTPPASLNLERLNVPENVTTMSNVLGTYPIYDSNSGFWSTWQGYMPLRHLHLPSTLTSLEKEDFSKFKELREVRFPSSLTTLSDVELPEISHFESTTPPTVINVAGNYALVIYVPASALNDYLNDPYWGSYYSIIQAEPS